MTTTRFGSLGMEPPETFNEGRARELAVLETARRRAAPGTTDKPQPRPWSERVKYNAAIGVTTNTPAGPNAGVKTPVGRVFAELRSVTLSAGTGPVEVTLIATENGVRVKTKAPAGITITGGTMRLHNFDEVDAEWAAGIVEEDLQTGVQTAVSSDLPIAVGGT